MAISDVTVSNIKDTHILATATITTTGLVYDSKNVDINITVTTSPRGIFFKPDGTKMYVVTQDSEPATTDYVYQYSLSTPWDISTATYDEVRINSGDSNPQGIFFNSDGDKMFVVGNYLIQVKSFALSTPWDLSTATAVGYKNVSAQDNNPFGVFFNPTGTKMYVTGYGGKDVNQYTLLTPWDLSTATYSQNYVLSEPDSVRCVFFNSTGSKMYVAGYNGTQAIYQYSLSTSWDVSTATYDKNYPVGSEDTSPIDVFINSANNKLYLSGQENNKVYQYSFREDYSERGFEYGLSERADWATRQTGSFNGSGDYSLPVSGLQPSTTYYIRAFFTDPAETTYSDNWVEFTTTASPSYGIYEESNTATICFYVRRAGGKWSIKHGPYTTDQADIEIAKILTEGKGKYQIKFTSDVLTGLSLNIMTKLDIKAR